MPATFESLRRLGTAFANAGFHNHTPWWREQLRAFYASGARRFVARVGRGGIKSTTMVDLAINEVVFGAWAVPLGEVHFFAFVSQNKSEAAQRLRQIAKRLQARGIPFDQAGDEIILKEKRLGFRVFACAVGAVSGFRCIGFVCDELSKWTNADHSANPAPEVVASLRAMCVTHPGAREFFVSSPLATVDLHYEMVEQGNSADQYVCSAPTWIANPSITEERTRKLEPDERIWRREYAAIPQDALASAFDPALVDAAVRPYPKLWWSRPVLAIDASSGGDCAFASCVVAWGRPATYGEPIENTTPLRDELGNDVSNVYLLDEKTGKVQRGPGGHAIVRADASVLMRPVLAVSDMDAAEGGWARWAGLDLIVAHLAEKAHAIGCRSVVGDQHLARALEMEFRRHGIQFKEYPTTASNKGPAVDRLRMLLAGRQIILPTDARLREELLGYREVISASGSIKHGARAGGSADRVSALITALVAEAEGELSWSPLWAGRKGRGGVPHEALG
jgi:hypothetical protein